MYALCTYTQAHTHICIHTIIYMCVCVHVRMCVCVYVCMCVSVYVCMCVCAQGIHTYDHIYVCMCTYTHIYDPMHVYIVYIYTYK